MTDFQSKEPMVFYPPRALAEMAEDHREIWNRACDHKGRKQTLAPGGWKCECGRYVDEA